MNRSLRPASLALGAALLLGGCLVLEGRPCSAQEDCVEGFFCVQETCVREAAPAPGLDAGDPDAGDLDVDAGAPPREPDAGAPLADAGAPDVDAGGPVFVDEVVATDVIVQNPLGDVLVLDNPDNELHVSALVHAGDPDVDVSVGFVQVSGLGNVDLVVLLPRAFAVEVASLQAEVQGRDGDVDMDAVEVRGSDLTGFVDVFAANNATVEATVGDDILINALTGDVSLTVPADVSCLVDAEASEVILQGIELSFGANILGTASGAFGALGATTQLTLDAPNGVITIIGEP